jgi:hypothetical protein
MDDATKSLGQQMRKFYRETCTKFVTKELPREVEVRTRRAARLRNKDKAKRQVPKEKQTALPKTLNLNIYKYHSLGDYTNQIRQFGTCDSYNTEIVSF